jgi:hypothetical protein
MILNTEVYWNPDGIWRIGDLYLEAVGSTSEGMCVKYS